MSLCLAGGFLYAYCRWVVRQAYADVKLWPLVTWWFSVLVAVIAWLPLFLGWTRRRAVERARVHATDEGGALP